MLSASTKKLLDKKNHPSSLILHLPLIIFLLFSVRIDAQTSSVLEDRLCKSWGLVKIEDGTKTQNADDAQKDYRIIFNQDHTVQQGLAPDGFIPGTWTLDEAKNEVVITDKSTKVSYTMKIIKLTTDELVLQQIEDSRTLIIYYKAS